MVGFNTLLWIESLFVTAPNTRRPDERQPSPATPPSALFSAVMPAIPGPPDTPRSADVMAAGDTQNTREIQQHKNGGLLFEFSDIGANPVVSPPI
jgi:hypothetical protein